MTKAGFRIHVPKSLFSGKDKAQWRNTLVPGSVQAHKIFSYESDNGRPVGLFLENRETLGCLMGGGGANH